MTALACDVTCPSCGGDLEFRKADATGGQAVTVLSCLPCRRGFQVEARLRLNSPPARPVGALVFDRFGWRVVADDYPPPEAS